MEYIALVGSFFFVFLEAIIRICTLALRKSQPTAHPGSAQHGHTTNT